MQMKASTRFYPEGSSHIFTPPVHSNWQIIIPFSHYFELMEECVLYNVNSDAEAVHPAVGLSSPLPLKA